MGIKDQIEKMRSLMLGILLLVIVPTLQAQDVTVTGTVFDIDTNKPLPGVNILVKGTDIGTASDANGNFIENVPSPTDTLVFSFLGYKTEEVPVDGRSEISVGLVPQAISGDEVVVVGYGEQQRKNVVGSVASMPATEVEDVPAANLSTLLEGRMAGVGVGQTSGKPGAPTSFSIRTEGSWNAEPPLFVIDGFIRDQEAFDALDPSEVESISVLKDASAAIYGARAAGGVVLVKTKRGKEGKATISYSGSFGLAQETRMTNMLSAYEQAQLRNDMLRTEFPDSYASEPEYYTEDELDHFKTVDYNWLEEAWEPAPTFRHTLNVSGGSDRVRYFAGGSYYDEKGNLPGTQYQKYTLRLGLDADITDNLTASMTLSSSYRKEDRPFNQEDRNPDPMRSTFTALLQTPRWIPSFINEYPVGQNGRVEIHPLEIERNGSYRRDRGRDMTINASIEYEFPFVEGFSARVAYSQNEDDSYGKQYSLDYYLYNFETSGQHNHIIGNTLVGDPYRVGNDEKIQESYNGGRNYQLNGNIAYVQDFGQHSIDAFVGFEQTESRGNDLLADREEAVIPGFEQQAGFSEAEDGTRSGSTAGGRLSYMGRLNYNYSDKYLLEAAFRYEGSIKFPPESRWGFFPSVGVGWRVSNEPFFSNNVDFIEDLKLRFSAGLLGNDNIATRQWELSYGLADGAYLGGSDLTNAIEARRGGLLLTGVSWEKSASYNGGMDVTFANNLGFSFDSFYRHTYDILTTRGSTLPTATGIDDMPDENYGRMASWGYEASIDYDAYISNEFVLNVGINMDWTKNKVLTKYQNPAVIGTWQDEIGKAPDGEVGFISTGIIRTQEELDAILAESPDYTIFGRTPELGMLNYKDVGGPEFSGPDGIIDDNDRRIIAPAGGELGFGINLGASWRGLRVSTNLGLSGIGQKVFFDEAATEPLEDGLNSPVFWRDHWTPENPDAAYPRPYEFGGAGETSTFWMRDALKLDLNVVNASYALPRTLLQQWGVSEVRVYFSGRNMWTIINPFDYKDPSVSRFNSYPLMRTFNFGLDIRI